MSVNFAYKYIFHNVGIFNMVRILRYGATRFIFPPKKSCYGFLEPLKVHRSRQGWARETRVQWQTR
jgi:hypothetical protein